MIQAHLHVGFFTIFFIKRASLKDTLISIQKNSVSKSVVYVMKHISFHLYRAHCDGVICKKLAIGDKYINKLV